MLPDGAGDEPYLAALRRLLARAPRADLAYVIAGGDVLAGDKMGRLGLTLAGARLRDLAVAALARRRPAGLAPRRRLLEPVLAGAGGHRPGGGDPVPAAHPRGLRAAHRPLQRHLGGAEPGRAGRRHRAQHGRHRGVARAAPDPAAAAARLLHGAGHGGGAAPLRGLRHLAGSATATSGSSSTARGPASGSGSSAPPRPQGGAAAHRADPREAALPRRAGPLRPLVLAAPPRAPTSARSARGCPARRCRGWGWRWRPAP